MTAKITEQKSNIGVKFFNLRIDDIVDINFVRETESVVYLMGFEKAMNLMEKTVKDKTEYAQLPPNMILMKEK